ncbi:hypothetical protein [Caenispirillum bisanense]|uniref:hypothetical protein n=1 Tax=Caenispirillum bisanense TaxID=414052 RepID=UPI0031D09EC0
MLGPHDLEDFWKTVDREREPRRATPTDGGHRATAAFAGLTPFASLSRMRPTGGLFGSRGE